MAIISKFLGFTLCSPIPLFQAPYRYCHCNALSSLPSVPTLSFFLPSRQPQSVELALSSPPPTTIIKAWRLSRHAHFRDSSVDFSFYTCGYFLPGLSFLAHLEVTQRPTAEPKEKPFLCVSSH